MSTLTPTRERIKEKAKARSKPKPKKTKPKDESFNIERFFGMLLIISIFVAIVSLGTYNFLNWVAFGFDKNYVEIKRCIDNKGKWDYSKRVCGK